MAKPEIQEEIASLLMKNSVGLTENAIIQQVTSTTNVKAITSALIRMKRFNYIDEAGKRWEITPQGRAFYSDLNKAEPVDYNCGGEDVQGDHADDQSQLIETTTTGIERIDSFKTPDGKVHLTYDDAEEHWRKQQQLDRIGKFIEHIGSPNKQRCIIISYITRWEEFRKQEQAA